MSAKEEELKSSDDEGEKLNGKVKRSTRQEKTSKREERRKREERMSGKNGSRLRNIKVIFFSMLHRFLTEGFSTGRLHISPRSIGFEFQTRFLCPFILVNIAEEEVARLVAGHDSGTHTACFAGDDYTSRLSRSCWRRH